jgi:hypothetical protein
VLLALAAVVPLAGCAGAVTRPSSTRPVARAESDARVDFARYRTFAWQPGVQPLTGEPRVDDPFLHERIERAVEDELARKGFTRVQAEDADMLLVYRLALREDFERGAIDNPGALGPSWAPGAQSQLFGRTYKRGSMVLDVVDPARRAIVWRGSVEREVSFYADPDQQVPAVREAVRALFSEFPPPKAQRGE